MLILTRRVGEMSMIGDAIRITVLDVKGNQVRLGVHGPKEVAVHREERACPNFCVQGGTNSSVRPREPIAVDHGKLVHRQDPLSG